MIDRPPEATAPPTCPDRGWAVKMIDYWRQEGARESLSRVVKEARAALCSRRIVKVMARQLGDPIEVFTPAVAAQFEEIGAARLAEIDPIMYHPTRVLRARFRKGDRCFVALVGGRPCASEWVALGNTQREVAGLALRRDQCYLYNARTARAWRGQRLYPFLLTAICARLRQEGFGEAVVRTDSSNQAALGAAERAGFGITMLLRSWRFLGVRYERVIWRKDVPEG